MLEMDHERGGRRSGGLLQVLRRATGLTLHESHVARAKVAAEYAVRFRPGSGLVRDRELEQIIEAGRERAVVAPAERR
jgi:hypothetical protein